MAFKIEFDDNNMPITPTFILSKRNGDAIGVITNLSTLILQNSIDVPNVTFQVFKDNNGVKCGVWEDLTDFKLAYCIEWDAWFELTVVTHDGDIVVKNVTANHLPESELSQIMLFDIEVNTEDDIARDDYTVPTVIFNQNNTDASLLHRILHDKAPHYTIYHVDESLRKIQRTFTFDNVSIRDALNQIATEINCLVIYGEGSSDERVPRRTISLYDLSYICDDCGYRGDIFDTCPKCGSHNIIPGYGDDTTIFVTKDNLTDAVEYSVDTEKVKNCFRLEAGDDLMTATVINCNPNGTAYFWYISDEMKRDMPTELVTQLEEYDALYQQYSKNRTYSLNASKVTSYNTLLQKYNPDNYNDAKITSPITGFNNLAKTMYDVLDFQIYLSDGMLPGYAIPETTAARQASLLINSNLSPVAVSNYEALSQATAESYVLEAAKIIVDSRYEVKLKESSYNSSTHKWTGKFTVTSNVDETDTATSATCTITISSDFKTYVEQKIKKILDKEETKDYSLKALFAMTLTKSGNTFSGNFMTELGKYNLTSLGYILSAAQTVIDLLIEQGVGDSSIWTSTGENLYNTLYQPYYLRLQAIEAEMAVREANVATVTDLYDQISDLRASVQDTLNLQNFLGNELWEEFCTYRREQSYSNSNFISDGLTNAEICQNAREFIEKAEIDIIKSATSQHRISSTFKNLLTIKEFSKLVDYFELWNWIRVEADGEIFKLRLVGYDINFDNLENINVEFSDVIKGGTLASDSASIFNHLTSISSSYDYVAKKSETGFKANVKVRKWEKDGFSADATPIVNNADNNAITMDEHGMLFREYNETEDYYSPTQLKIINSTLAITTDGWNSTKAAIGLFKYVDPETGDIETAYGVNGEVVVGKLLLGNSLGVYNSTGSMKFDENGLFITNGLNSFTVNPNNNSKLLSISNASQDVLWVDSNGALNISGKVTATSGTIGGITANSSYGLYTNSKTSATSTQSGFLISKNGAIYLGAYNSTDGACPFQVTANGVLTAKGATINGVLNATSGTIGANATNKITIGSNSTNASIYSGMSSLSNTSNNGFYLGTDGLALGKGAFKVTSAGALTATSATITGAITATSGTIGAANATNKITIGTNSTNASIYYGMSTLGNTSNNGFYIGADGIALGKGAFKVTSDGTLTATKATITGTITASTLTLTGSVSGLNYSSIDGTPNLTVYIAKDGTISGTQDGQSRSFTVSSKGLLTATNAIITGNITATSGTIGGCTISNGTLQIGGTNISSDSITVDHLNISKLSSIASNLGDITAGSINIGSGKFIVTSAGALTATSATITGSITANSGTIGGCSINSSGSLQVSNDHIISLNADKITAGTISADRIAANSITSGKISVNNLAAINSNLGAIDAGSLNIGSGKFIVTSAGALTATSASITGAITATSGTIGAASATNKITIGTNSTNASIYYGMSSLGNTSSNGFYLGTDGIALGKGAFKVTSAGALTATSATITGAITATSGTIGAANATNKITIGTNATNASIYYGMSSLGNTSSNGFYIGTDGIALGKGAFKVTAAGALTATSANITGTITATAGTIGGCQIVNGQLQVPVAEITSLDASKITSGTLSADRIAANSIVAGKLNIAELSSIASDLGAITGGSINIGSGAFTVSNAGALKATSATITGKITANSGTIGGCPINNSGNLQVGNDYITGVSGSKVSARSLAGSKLELSAVTADEIAAGTITALEISAGAITSAEISVQKLDAISSDLGNITAGSINIGSGKFTVSSAGVLTASGATVKGDIRASTLSAVGEIGFVEDVADLSGSTIQYDKKIALLFGDFYVVDGNNYDEIVTGTGLTNVLSSYMTKPSGVTISNTEFTTTGALTITSSSSGRLILTNSTTEVSLGTSETCFRAPTETTSLGTSSKLWTTVYAKNATISTSDRKDKDILGGIDFAKDLIMSLKPIRFMWKNGDHRRTRMGFIAQDIAETCKVLNQNLAVVTASYKLPKDSELDDPIEKYYGEEVDDEQLQWGTSYDQLIAPMVKVIQEQEARIAQLESKLNGV